MEITHETMQRLKSCELSILKAFISVCDMLKLRYFLVEGTLLGAVRHGGFIPWDDDIDVALLREDYERFLREGQALLPDYYFLQTFRTDPGYAQNFAKIRDSRTTFVESSARHQKINHGVYIDIFPLDFYPEGKVKQKLVSLCNKLLSVRVMQAYDMPVTAVPLWKKIRSKVLRVIMNLAFPQLEGALEAREKLYCLCASGEMVTNYCSAWGVREVVPFPWYGWGASVLFEGLSVNAPQEYDKLLTAIYSDYMQPPPPEKQIPHHYAEFVDLDKPYTCYVIH